MLPGDADKLLAAKAVDEAGLPDVGVAKGAKGEDSLLHIVSLIIKFISIYFKGTILTIYN